jgi:hypothetical protein
MGHKFPTPMPRGPDGKPLLRKPPGPPAAPRTEWREKVADPDPEEDEDDEDEGGTEFD